MINILKKKLIEKVAVLCMGCFVLSSCDNKPEDEKTKTQQEVKNVQHQRQEEGIDDDNTGAKDLKSKQNELDASSIEGNPDTSSDNNTKSVIVDSKTTTKQNNKSNEPGALQTKEGTSDVIKDDLSQITQDSDDLNPADKNKTPIKCEIKFNGGQITEGQKEDVDVSKLDKTPKTFANFTVVFNDEKEPKETTIFVNIAKEDDVYRVSLSGGTENENEFAFSTFKDVKKIALEGTSINDNIDKSVERIVNSFGDTKDKKIEAVEEILYEIFGKPQPPQVLPSLNTDEMVAKPIANQDNLENESNPENIVDANIDNNEEIEDQININLEEPIKNLIKLSGSSNDIISNDIISDDINLDQNDNNLNTIKPIIEDEDDIEIEDEDEVEIEDEDENDNDVEIDDFDNQSSTISQINSRKRVRSDNHYNNSLENRERSNNSYNSNLLLNNYNENNDENDDQKNQSYTSSNNTNSKVKSTKK